MQHINNKAPVEPRDWIIIKGYGFLYFATTMDKNIGKNISKRLSGKYSIERFDQTKKSALDAVKTS